MTNKNLRYSPYKSLPQIVQDLLQLPKTTNAVMKYFEGVDVVVLDFVEEQLDEILGPTAYQSPEFQHIYFGIMELREALRVRNMEAYENTLLPEVIYDINAIADFFVHPFMAIEAAYKIGNMTESEFTQSIEHAVRRIKNWYKATAGALKVMELELLDIKINYPKDRRRVSIDPTFIAGEYKLSYNNTTLYFTFGYIQDTLFFSCSFDPNYPKQSIPVDTFFTTEGPFAEGFLASIFDVEDYY
jgi:hypothetical protein